MERKSGKVSVGGRIAYAAQQPWIVNASLKDNVTFGQEFDEQKWQDTVSVFVSLMEG